MQGIHLQFETDDFVDDAASVAERVNEALGGAALARWLASEARNAGLEASEAWVEDHGWDFSIKDDDAAYLCVCSIEDASEPPREAHVTITRHRSLWDRLRGRGHLEKSDRVVASLRAIVEGRIGKDKVAADWAS